MLDISSLLKNIELKEALPKFKSRRDELVSNITDYINRERQSAGYKPLTKRVIALQINKNPFLSKDDDEVDLLYKDCVRKGNFKKFWWVTNKK